MKIYNHAWKSPKEEYESAAIRLALHRLLVEEATDISNEQMDAETAAYCREKHDQILNMLTSKSRSIRRNQSIMTIVPKVAKVAAFAILFCNLAVTLAFAGSSTVRAKVMTFFEHTYETHTSIGFMRTDETMEIPIDWKAPYYPTYIPDGFNMTDIWSSNRSVRAKFTNEGNDIIRIIIGDGEVVTNIDTENKMLKSVIVQGIEANLYYDDNQCYITWHEGDMSFVIYSTLSSNECLKIAQSMVLIDR